MSMLQKALETLAKVRGDVQSELKRHEAELERLNKERSVTERLPVPKAEFLQRLDAAVDSQRKDYDTALHALLQPLTKPGPVHVTVNPLGLTPVRLLNGVVPPLSVPDKGTVTGFALQGLLADVIKDAVHQSVERMQYPAEVGLPQAERNARLAELNKEAGALEAKVAELRGQLHEAGLRV